jgi:cystathionine beta-lyase
MPHHSGVDRRTFLRGAGATALLGAVGVEPALARRPSVLLTPEQQAFDFDEIYDRFGTDCTKWDGAVASYGDGIEVGMGVADMDFRAAPCITRALAERCAHENWGYLRRPERYAEAVVDWNRRRYGLDIDPETIQWTTGVHPGLIAAILTFAPPGTRVLLTSPVYSGFYSDVRFTRTVAEESPMTLVDGRYSIDFDDFERRAARSNVFILCNPQNPTGNCWSAEDMTRMGEICLRHRVPVLADEIHCDFVTKGNTYTPFASLDREIVDNSLTFKAASKTFSLAAMKVAWYFSTNPDYLERVRSNTRADLTTLGMEANYAALSEGHSWFDQLLPYLDANHDYVEAYIRGSMPYVSYVKAQGTYLAWLDVTELVDALGAKEIAAEESARSVQSVAPEDVVQRWVANNAGVYLNPGDNYGRGGENHMRMNLGTSRRLIQRALDNMSSALVSL